MPPLSFVSGMGTDVPNFRREKHMKHRLVAFALGAGLAVALGTTQASAAPPETTTTTTKNLVETFVDVVPTCDASGADYTITTTSNLVEHETVFDDGRWLVWDPPITRLSIELLVKEVIARPRPAGAPLVPGTDFSYPSGHVLAAAATWGFIPVIAALYIK